MDLHEIYAAVCCIFDWYSGTLILGCGWGEGEKPSNMKVSSSTGSPFITRRDLVDSILSPDCRL